MTLFIVTFLLSIQLSSSKPFILSEATLDKMLKKQLQEDLLSMRKPTNWYGKKAGQVFDKILQSFKKFTEMKVFDPIQIKIKQHRVKVSDSKYYSYPEDSTKNHYFLG